MLPPLRARPGLAVLIEELRVGIGVLYIVLAVLIALRQHRDVRMLVSTAMQVFRNPKAFAEAHAEV